MKRPVFLFFILASCDTGEFILEEFSFGPGSRWEYEHRIRKEFGDSISIKIKTQYWKMGNPLPLGEYIAYPLSITEDTLSCTLWYAVEDSGMFLLKTTGNAYFPGFKDTIIPLLAVPLPLYPGTTWNYGGVIREAERVEYISTTAGLLSAIRIKNGENWWTWIADIGLVTYSSHLEGEGWSYDEVLFLEYCSY